MQILADESCDFRMIQDLRNRGLEVDSVLEQDQGATDHAVIQAAIEDRKILRTEDRDFGRQVFVEGRSQTGVILLRYPHKTYAQISERTAELIERGEEKLMAFFVVVQPGNELPELLINLLTAPTEAAVRASERQRKIWIEYLENIKNPLKEDDSKEVKNNTIKEHLSMAPVWSTSAKVSSDS